MSDQIYQEIEIPSSYEHAKEVEDCIVAAAQECAYNEEDLFAIRLSLEEAISNAIRHGNANGPDKKVSVRYYVNQDRIDIYVADEGPGFDPTSIPDPTLAENLDRPNGRGIMLMRAYMNLVEYIEPGNIVHIVKLNPKTQEQLQ